MAHVLLHKLKCLESDNGYLEDNVSLPEYSASSNHALQQNERKLLHLEQPTVKAIYFHLNILELYFSNKTSNLFTMMPHLPKNPLTSDNGEWVRQKE